MLTYTNTYAPLSSRRAPCLRPKSSSPSPSAHRHLQARSNPGFGRGFLWDAPASCGPEPQSPKPVGIAAVRREGVQRRGALLICDRGARSCSRRYIEHSDRAKRRRGAAMGGRSRSVAVSAGSSSLRAHGCPSSLIEKPRPRAGAFPFRERIRVRRCASAGNARVGGASKRRFGSEPRACQPRAFAARASRGVQRCCSGITS